MKQIFVTLIALFCLNSLHAQSTSSSMAFVGKTTINNNQTLYNINTSEDNSTKMVTSRLTVMGQNTFSVPTNFSPNKDGIDDVFKVKGQNIVEMEMIIFNQWGESVFQTNEGIDGWNGEKDGKLVKTGPYIYTIKLKTSDSDEVQKLSGCIMVEH